MSKYRIEVIKEANKPTLYQPQVLFEVNSELQQTPEWTNLIKDIISITATNVSHQTWDTKEKAMEVINLHKKQSEPKIIKEYIIVE